MRDPLGRRDRLFKASGEPRHGAFRAGYSPCYGGEVPAYRAGVEFDVRITEAILEAVNRGDRDEAARLRAIAGIETNELASSMAPKGRQILRVLSAGENTSEGLSEACGSPTYKAISAPLRRLIRDGLVTMRAEWRSRYYQLTDEGREWLEEHKDGEGRAG